jgi:hypothetical protein
VCKSTNSENETPQKLKPAGDKLTHQEHNRCSLTTIHGWSFPAGLAPGPSKYAVKDNKKRGGSKLKKAKDLVFARLTKLTLRQFLKKLPRRANACFMKSFNMWTLNITVET